MSQNEKKEKKNKKNKKKMPIRRAKHWGQAVPGAAGKMVPMLIVIIIMGLLMTGIQAIDTYIIRAGLGALLSFAAAFLIYAEGLNRGIADISASRSCVQSEKAGHTVSEKEEAGCYHPLKALCTVGLVFGLPMILAIIIAFNAREYTYTLQSLPTWLKSSYGTRSDIMAPLGAYMQRSSMVILDWIRMLVRLFILPMVNLFEDPQKMTAMIDRFSPLMLSVLPIAYMIGYLLAPRRARKIQTQNRRAKKVAVRRAERKKVGPELLGSQNQVHYGHQKEEKARKKKELI